MITRTKVNFGLKRKEKYITLKLSIEQLEKLSCAISLTRLNLLNEHHENLDLYKDLKELGSILDLKGIQYQLKDIDYINPNIINELIDIIESKRH